MAVQRGDEIGDIGEGPEPRVDGSVVVDVVAAVGERRWVERAQPDGIHPQASEMVDLLDDAGDVTETVAVGVPERAGIHLVDDGIAPPIRVCGDGGPVHG